MDIGQELAKHMELPRGLEHLCVLDEGHHCKKRVYALGCVISGLFEIKMDKSWKTQEMS